MPPDTIGPATVERTMPVEVTARDTLPAVVEALAATRPDQPFVITDERTFTAREFAESCRSVAGSLRELGLPKGSAVGVLLPNGWRWLAAMLSLNAAGLVAVPLNTWYKDAELRTARRKARLTALISQRTFYGRDYAEVLASADLIEPQEPPAAIDPQDSSAAGAFRGTFFWDAGDLPERLTEGRAMTADEVIAAVEPDDASMYAFTSGSSAEPKVVVLNHRCLVRNALEMGRRQHLVPGDRLWFAAPLFFGYGCCNALPVAIVCGATLCVQERFEAKDAARFIEQYTCTVYYGLGPMNRAIVASGALDEYDVSSLRTGTTGFSADEKRLARDVIGVRGVCSVYGLTEGYGHSTMTDADDDDDAFLYTQGTAVPTQEIRCVDPDTGTELTATDGSAFGEVHLRGCITPGYLDDPEVNHRTFTDDGWFRTGDLGWLDGERRLHFAGRLKEVIKVNGITVSPAEVEAFVMEHPLVDQAYALGWPVTGPMDEALCCGVVLVPRIGVADDDAEAAIRQWLRERVSSYKVPRLFVFMTSDSVPLTATGKVNKRLIGELFIATVKS
jgi:acyl-CoA synthetase (AMP-forming)/AMP-acid ligase II